jgi:hypothetical protein
MWTTTYTSEVTPKDIKKGIEEVKAKMDALYPTPLPVHTDLSRTTLFELGHKGPYHRFLDFPTKLEIEIAMSWDRDDIVPPDKPSPTKFPLRSAKEPINIAEASIVGKSSAPPTKPDYRKLDQIYVDWCGPRPVVSGANEWLGTQQHVSRCTTTFSLDQIFTSGPARTLDALYNSFGNI